MAKIYGWDIGGANLKVARASAGRGLEAVHIIPCPLWRGIGTLNEALAATSAFSGPSPDGQALHAVTMTGELVDAFEDRARGVAEILAAFSDAVAPDPVQVFASPGRWLAHGAAATPAEARAVASANWIVTGSLVARACETAIAVDLGSTTMDVVPAVDGAVRARGRDDYSRLATGELVYLGVVRTPLFHVLPEVEFEGRRRPVVPETFADLGDALVAVGCLDPTSIATPALDGRPRDGDHALARIARALGTDGEPGRVARFLPVAHAAIERVLDTIEAAIDAQRRRLDLPPDSPVVGAGVGRVLVSRVCANRGWPYRDLSDVFAPLCTDPALGGPAADAAPAAALALVAGGFPGRRADPLVSFGE